MSTTIHRQVLINARALIADPARWTMWMLASTASGRPVTWHDRAARRWCAVGAVHRAAFDLLGDRGRAITIASDVIAGMAVHATPRMGLPALNDAHGHAAVIALFDRVLAASTEDRPAAASRR
jgi:hypothetical protein